MVDLKKNIEKLTKELQSLKDENNSLKVKTSKAESNSNIYESLYHSILSATHDAIVLTDISGKITSTSPNTAKILGYKPDYNFIDHSFLEYLDISDHTKAFEDIQKMAGGEKATPKEYTAIKSDGTKVYIEVNNDVIRDKEGKPIRFLVIIHDITHRKKATEALKASEQRYQTTLDNMMEGCQIISFDWVYLYLNDAAIKTARRPREDFINHTMEECYPGIMNTQLFVNLKRCMEERISNSFEDVFIYPDKTTAWLEFRVQPAPEGIFILTLNISNRKIAEEKIAETNKKLSRAQRIAKIGSWERSLVNNEITWSDQMYKIMGISPDNPIDIEEVKSLFSPEETVRYSTAINNTIKKDALYSMDYKIVLHDGTVRYIHDEGEVVRDDNGTPLGMNGTTQDITERKLAEAEILQATEKLEHAQRIAKIGSWDKDMTTDELNWSDEMYKLMRIPHQKPLDINKIMTLLSPEDVDRFDYAINNAIKNGIPYQLDYKVVHPDGATHYFHDEGEIVRDKKGNPIWMYGTTQDITERKLAEILLRESEERYSKTFQTFPYAITITRIEDGKLIEFNKALIKNTGYTKDELQNSSSSGLNLWADINDRYRMADKIKEGKEVIQMETQFKKKNGDNLDCTISATIINLQEKPYILSIITDISERKKAELLYTESEEKIRQQNDRLSAIINAIPDLLFVLNREGTFLEFYSSSSETIMTTPDKIIGSNLNDLFDENMAKLHLQKIEECLQKKSLVSYDYSVNRGNTTSYLEARVVPLDKDRVLVFGRNITDKKEKDLELLKLSQVVEQSPNSIFITDLDANIEYANKAFYYTTGYNSDEVIGQKPSILKSGEMDDSIYKSLWETITSQKMWTGELINKKKNGESIWEHVSISPLKNDKGTTINYLAIKKDISQRKEHDKKVLELNTTLEKEIIETNLAKEKAEESDRLKSAFLANMSHEIRTPLNAILGFTQLLTTDIETPPEVKEEFWSIINRSSDNLLQIINDILDISKLETKQVNIKKKSHDISQTMEELHLIFQKKLADAGKANIKLKLTKPKKAIWLKTDNNRLTQIFMNLLNNSIKFTKKGEIEFGISKVSKDRINFFVNDTGIGIKEEYLGTIYDRFRQGDDSTTRAYGGAGLGLAIVKNLIELMGGEISVTSKEGKGTKTTFFLYM